MGGGTKLFQRPGSPLIQGHSRSDSPLWKSVLTGTVLSAVWAVIAWYAFGLGETSLGIVYIVGAVVGSYIGAYVGRMWGAKRRWVPALAVGLLLAHAAALSMQAFAPTLL